jgi:hypothetical protein
MPDGTASSKASATIKSQFAILAPLASKPDVSAYLALHQHLSQLRDRTYA